MTTTTESPQVTDRIEKRFEVRAPQARVWRALADATEFGAWFGMTVEGTFAVGVTVRGQITHPGYCHMTMDLQVVALDAPRYFAYRWHPYPIDPKVDYSTEPTTLVEFHLAPVAGGTAITIVESGFDQIPLARRAEAFRMDDQGWTGQVKSITRYVEQS
ncbi:MAG: SRPBCC family protein [Gemmatimonadetes bacterium]|jgi:uncharacterized protein YndB with AHSA1/START domain|nr:SRPBCC family protein [Gemmatimonadota bacterium]MBK7785757.1 SRPBCC family protein [Gemmatimonadota bacterium]MBK9067119.1 SRPBCC family protein [Gemmatimonadota bacterium]